MGKSPRKSGKAGHGAKRAVPDAIIVNGWTLYAHPLLLDQLETLEARSAERNDPQAPARKVLAWLVRAMFDEIPQDPSRPEYRQGHTLGSGYTHWFRDKYAGRFRLFFRYDSRARIIVYGWVNDEDTLRAYGSKTDAYAVFKGMLESGSPPNNWDELLRSAADENAVTRLKGKASKPDSKS